MTGAEARNAPPRHVWEALRRLLRCNRQQLAERMDVSPRTLRRWEAQTEAGESPGRAAEDAASRLLIDTLRAADNADFLAFPRVVQAGAALRGRGGA